MLYFGDSRILGFRVRGLGFGVSGFRCLGFYDVGYIEKLSVPHTRNFHTSGLAG